MTTEKTDNSTSVATSSESNLPLNWNVGDVILDLYEVEEVFAGGMGLVYRVHHREWNVDLAVKSPRSKYFRTESQKENFVREAETWVNLGMHPNIVNCYYVRTLGGIPRVFTEYIATGSLSDWIRQLKLYKHGPQRALARILDVAIQISWGLHYAHEQGLIHQDVKPSNMMLSADLTTKITDFGLTRARLATGEASENTTIHGAPVPGAGLMTVAYCSPEQADRQPLTTKTDLWSWGVSVLEMFCGEPPCRYGRSAAQVFESYLQAGGEKSAFIPAMPHGLVEILRACFQENPSNRPHDLLQIANELREIYRASIGESYPRLQPKAAELLADGFNNRAVSYIDLAKQDQAEASWQAALAIDQQHPEAVYNRGTMLWRQGQLTDDVFVKQLESVVSNHRERGEAKHMLALAHLARGDLDSAAPLIRETSERFPEDSDVRAAAKAIESDEIPVGRCIGVLEGHKDSVTGVSISSDGHLVLSGSGDGTLRLWESDTGNCLRVFEGHESDVLSVCLSRDGRFALSGSSDETVRLWDLRSGKCIRVFTGHTCWVRSVSLSGDGRLAISGGGDNYHPPEDAEETFSLRVWEVETGSCLRILKGHVNIVQSVQISEDGQVAISGGQDWSMRFWELGTARCLGVREPHNFWVGAVGLSRDARYVISGSGDVYNRDTTLHLWDGTTGEWLRTFAGHTECVNSVCLSNDSRFALSASEDQTIRLWEVSSGRCVRTFEGHTRAVTAVSLSDNARLAVSGSHDGTARIWEVPVPPASVGSLRLSRPWSHAELSDVRHKFARLIGNANQSINGRDYPSAIAHICGARDLPGCARKPEALDAWARLYPHCHRRGLRSAWLARVFEGHTSHVTGVCIPEDGKTVVSGSGQRGGSIHGDFIENVIKIWDTNTGRCLRTLDGEFNRLNSISLNRDASLALIGTGEKTFKSTEGGGLKPSSDSCETLQLWDLSQGERIRFFEGHRGWTSSACFSVDGRFALSGGGDETVRLWEVASGNCLRVFRGHAVAEGIDPRQKLLKFITGRVEAVSLSFDMRWAVSGSGDTTLILWDVANGRCLRRLIGHRDAVSSVCFSQDTQHVLSGSDDGTLRWWELATGHCKQVFAGHIGHVTSICLSSDGQFAVSSSEDSTLRLWDISSGTCVWVFEGHKDRVTSINLSSDNRFIVSGSIDNTVRLWELDWDLQA